MEKYLSRVDFSVFLIFLLLCILDIASLILWIFVGTWWPALTISLIILILVAPQYFFTYYVLNDTCLKINFGIFLINYKIPYDKILAISPVYSSAMGPKLSNKTVRIVFITGEKSHTIYISPASFDAFMDSLSDKVIECIITTEGVVPVKIKNASSSAKDSNSEKMRGSSTQTKAKDNTSLSNGSNSVKAKASSNSVKTKSVSSLNSSSKSAKAKNTSNSKNTVDNENKGKSKTTTSKTKSTPTQNTIKRNSQNAKK